MKFDLTLISPNNISIFSIREVRGIIKSMKTKAIFKTDHQILTANVCNKYFLINVEIDVSSFELKWLWL